MTGEAEGEGAANRCGEAQFQQTAECVGLDESALAADAVEMGWARLEPDSSSPASLPCASSALTRARSRPAMAPPATGSKRPAVGIKREMERVGIFEAKSRLSELVERAEAGAEVTITRHGKPVAKLVPAKAEPPIDRAALFKEIGALRRRMKLKKALTLRDIRQAVESGRR